MLVKKYDDRRGKERHKMYFVSKTDEEALWELAGGSQSSTAAGCRINKIRSDHVFDLQWGQIVGANSALYAEN